MAEQTCPVVSHDALDALFRPRSIAIVGASGRADNPFGRPLRLLHERGFEGSIYPVNPRYSEIADIQCFPSLEVIPGPVDLVLSMVSAADTIAVIRSAGAVGAKAVIVFASGFAETGERGRELQDELVAEARRSGVVLLGPNCQGAIFRSSNLFATFTAAVHDVLPEPGGIAYLGQSGAVGGSVLDLSREMGIGLAAWVSTGNQAMVDLVDLGLHLIEDDEISVLMMYMEAPVDGELYSRLAARARELGKAMVVLRSGRSTAGRRAVESHTGAMVGPEVEFDLVSRREGVVAVEDVNELLSVSHALGATRRARGKKVAVITTSGGAGSLAADHLEGRGLEVAPLPPDTQEALREVVPAFGSVVNPVDVTAQLFSKGGSAFQDVCMRVAADDEVDIVFVVLTMLVGEPAQEVARGLSDEARDAAKPLIVVWLAGDDQTSDGRSVYRQAGIPVFRSVGDGAQAAAALVEVVRDADKPAPDPQVSESDVGWVDVAGLRAAVTSRLVLEAESGPVLDAIGVRRPKSALVHSRAEAESEAKAFAGQLALKAQGPDLLHKTELGGVRLNVEADQVGPVYDDLASLDGTQVDGVLIQEMVEKGHELLIGVTASDHGYPPMLTLGFGGINTEIYGDVVSRLLPVDAANALEMLQELRGWPLLVGYRGSEPCDLAAVADIVARISTAVLALEGQVLELEINPLVVHQKGNGATAVDFMLKMAEGTEGDSHGKH